MNRSCVIWSVMLYSMLLRVSVPVQASDLLDTLWQIGQSDNSTAEFAFAPKDYKGYQESGFFVIGQSDAKRNWPYVQPGPTDGGWAPGTPQAFEIIFGLDSVPTESCRLVLDFVDTHSSDPPELRVKINSQDWRYQTPRGAGDASIFGDSSMGREHVITVDVPADTLMAGNNHVSITTVSGCWVLWDAVMFEAPTGTKTVPVQPGSSVRSITAKPVLMWQQDREVQPITLDIAHVGESGEAVVRIGQQETKINLRSGIQTVEVFVRPVENVKVAKVQLVQGGRITATSQIKLTPVRRWEIHLIHQTHLDIGFTHKQTDVLKRQVQYLYQALDFIKQTSDYPEDAKFKWHPEGMWAIEEFLRTADNDKREEFLDAIRKGYIHLDGFYANLMTGLATEEELIQLLEPAKRLGRDHGVEVLSALGSDVPGYTWGLVSAMGQMGLKYLNMAPNNNMRLGYLYLLANKPFYWIDPSGNHKILCWMNTHCYIYFLSGGRSDKIGPAVVDYISNTLERNGFPYDIAQLRFSIGDNGPPDLNLAKQVKDWNEKYAYPKIILSTNTRLFREFERRYGKSIPSYAGDLTPYWEDGAASTSAGLAVNRDAKEKLIQAERLWSLLCPSADLRSEFDKAWHNVVMYDEHTWGAHSSITEPFDEFTVFQEKYKQQFALNARDIAERIIAQTIEPIAVENSRTVDIYNTVSWARSGPVLISAAPGMDRLLDDTGAVVPTQRLASGDLIALLCH